MEDLANFILLPAKSVTLFLYVCLSLFFLSHSLLMQHKNNLMDLEERNGIDILHLYEKTLHWSGNPGDKVTKNIPLI